MKQENKKIDYFGFLPRKWSIIFDNIKILPLENYSEIKSDIDNYKHLDGFLYPPMSRRKSYDLRTKKMSKDIANTQKPALGFPIFKSHSILIDSETSIQEDRDGQAAFLIHLLGYICGTRVQFHNWLIDKRVKIKDNAGIRIIDETTANHFLKYSLGKWKSWEQREQFMITNILFMFSRAVSYDWDWERFMIDYMVLDGLFKIYKNQNEINKIPTHGQRIKFLCDKFDIEYIDDVVKKIVDLRNNLYHEALWARTQPTSGKDVGYSKYVRDLHRLNECLIPAILGYNNNYGKRNWTSMTACSFEIPK